MPETRVQDEQGNIHVFPDGSTPEMIAKALNVKPPTAKGPQFSAPPEESTLKKVARGATIGAFEGAGVKPATTPREVITGTAGQFKEGLKNLVKQSYEANSRFIPELRGTATILDLVPTFIESTANTLEQGGREAITAAKRGDYEEAAEKGASTLTSALMLRGGKSAAEEGLSKVGQLRKSAREGLQPFARKVTGVEPAVKESVAKAAEKHGEALAEHEATSENVAQRGELSKNIDQQSVQLREKLSQVEQAVGKEANRKFDAVHEKIGNPEAAPDNLVATVRSVEHDILQDIPENIKEFRAILKHEPLPESLAEAARTHLGFDPEGPEQLTWDKLQSLKSRLDTRLRTRRAMNGDLRRALYQTRDSVVEEMGKMADANGASAEWADAKNFWRNYKQDFHEPSGPSGSGSPIAQSLDAVDPKNIRQPFLRTQSSIGNRGIETLRKYGAFGGTEVADQVSKLISGHEELQNLPTRPKGFSPNKLPTAPTVDISKVARDAITQRAKNWGSFNARDIGILSSGIIGGALEHFLRGGGYEFPAAVATYEGGKFGASRLLNKPAVVEWLAKTPQSEIEVINKIPGADKVRIVDGLTQIAVDSAKSKPVRLSPQVRQLLGPANVRRIIVASGASQGNIAASPGDAKKRMSQFAPPSQ